MASKKFIQALELLEEEKGIKKEVVLDALKEALEKSYKKNYAEPDSVIRAEIDEKSGKIRIFEVMTVVDDVDNEDFEISLEEARELNPNYQIGDEIVNEADPEIFGRLAAIQTKQLLRQKIKEAEKEALFNEFIDKKDEIITGIVDRVEERFAIIQLGRNGALLPKNFQIPGEKIYEGQHIKVYVSDVEKTTKGTHIGVSRTDPGLVKRLFEAEVPEIFDGVVEIKSVSREAGERSKIAVYTNNPDIDPIGSCVGQKGSRVRAVVNELNGEMIDIIEWSENPEVYITHALAPSSVLSVSIDETNHSALVIVPDNQLSLAIGKKGQNARLAVRLTGWKIDIKSASEAANEGIVITKDSSFEEEFAKEMLDTEEEILIEDVVVEDVKEEINEFDDELAESLKALTDAQKENTTSEVHIEVISSDEDEYYDDYDDEDEDDYDDYDDDIDYDEYDHYYDD